MKTRSVMDQLWDCAKAASLAKKGIVTDLHYCALCQQWHGQESWQAQRIAPDGTVVQRFEVCTDCRREGIRRQVEKQNESFKSTTP